MTVKKIDPTMKYSNKDIPYSNDMRRLILAKQKTRVVFVINVSTLTRTYWCFTIKVSKNKLIYYKIYNAKKLIIKLSGAIPSTKPLYYYCPYNNYYIIFKLVNDTTNGAIINAISVYNVSNCKMYKVTVYIILELRLILVPKYLIQILENTLTPSDQKWLKYGANYHYTHYFLNECIRYLTLVLTFPKNNDRYVKAIKVYLPGDLKSRFNVFNVIWTGYTNVDLAGKMLYVWGYCEWRTTRYRKYRRKTIKLRIHNFNLSIEISILNKSTSMTP